MSRGIKETGSTAKLVRAGRATSEANKEYVPKTARGRDLMEIRRRIIAEGAPLLTPEGVAREVRKRRGGSSSA